MKRLRSSLLQRLLVCLTTLIACAWPLGATWSIVAVNTRTGEVAVASATCLINVDLQALTPALVVGRGAGAVQASSDTTGALRAILFQGFQDGRTASEIIALLDQSLGVNIESWQFGVVSLDGAPASRTGSLNGAAARSARGTVGDIKFAVQGNVLAGRRVVMKAKEAFVDAQGDLSQRIMAAMEVAAAYGGDGRCSCGGSNPTSCGSPPTGGFDKSAHVGYVIVARMGDTDGTCAGVPVGCANGDYWLSLNVIGGINAVDPVVQLRTRYDRFRRRKRNRPDGTTSRVAPDAQAVPADGVTTTTLSIALHDIDGDPLDHGDANVTVVLRPGSIDVRTGPMVNNGDGTYSCELTSGRQTGKASFEVVATQGNLRALVFPYPELRVDPVAPLHCGVDVVSPGPGVRVPFVINAPEAAKLPYLVLGTTSGTEPGMDLGGLHLPLNKDVFFARSLGLASTAQFPGTAGVLDAAGRGMAAFHIPGRIHLDLLGTRVDWTAVLFGAKPTATNVVGFEITDALAQVEPEGPAALRLDR